MEMLVFVVLVAGGATAWRLRQARRRRQRESSRPGYIAVSRVDRSQNGYPVYYTYEMRRAGRHRRA